MSTDSEIKNISLLSEEKVKFLLSQFDSSGELLFYKIINKGYINQTYFVKTQTEDNEVNRYILQRINDYVFRDVDALVQNAVCIYEHTKETFHLTGTPEGHTSLIPLIFTKDNKPYYRDETGCWRLQRFVEKITTYDIPNNPKLFREAGFAFGSFIKALCDIDQSKIKTTIPDFHNTPKRYEQLLEAIKEDRCGRVKDVLPEIENLKANASFTSLISDALDRGDIPTRICHNDCNLNNILFDIETDDPVAIIDLDTVMPSSPLYDYGDSMRIGTNTAKDDEKDLSKVYCDLDYYKEYADGFLYAAKDFLTEKELSLLPYSPIIITAEDAIRFLTDYLNGDVYYKTSYEGQNLDRARTQIRLAYDMTKKLPQIKKILNNIYKKYEIKYRHEIRIF